MTARPPGDAHGDTDPHGAVWCGDHTRWECSKKSKRSGERCHDVALVGRHACKLHVGESTAVAKAKGEANVLAYTQLTAWSPGAGADLASLDPAVVVMGQLYVAVQRQKLFGERLRLQLVAQADGLVGATFAAGREGMRVETGESVRALAKVESEERDRVVRFAKTAHDMGIDERNIEIEQVKAARVVSSFLSSFEAMWNAVAVFIAVESRAAAQVAARDAAVGRFLEGIGRGDDPAVVAGEVTA